MAASSGVVAVSGLEETDVSKPTSESLEVGEERAGVGESGIRGGCVAIMPGGGYLAIGGGLLGA